MRPMRSLRVKGKPLDLNAIHQRAVMSRLAPVPNSFVVEDIHRLIEEVEHLRHELNHLQAACTIGLPYAKGEAADVLRQAIERAKGVVR